MASTVAVLGPFTGGLNKASDASAIAENELSELINLNTDLDGSLVCRPPIGQVPYTVTRATIPPEVTITGRILVIGNAILNSISYLIVSCDQGIIAFKESTTTTGGVEWFEGTVIHSTLKSDCAIQLHDVVYILARYDSPVIGGTWDGTTYLTDSSPNAPTGSAALFFKGRVFVCPGAYNPNSPVNSQLKFSDPVPLTLPVTIPWSAVNLIPVGQGDGQFLIDMVVVADNLMLFKNNSTYAYLYDVSPNDGILRKVNNNIGVSAQFCVLTHGNEVYTYHEGNVYQISNYTFVEASIKLPFTRVAGTSDQREKVSMSLLKDMLLVRYFDKMYALNLQTKTWSEWQSANGVLNTLGRIIKVESNRVTSQEESYYGGSYSPSNNALMRIKPEHTSSDSEYVTTLVSPSLVVTQVPIACTMTTKIYDFGAPHVFKRLMWWGVDIISDGNVTGIVSPVRQSGSVTWTDLSTLLWSSLNAWDNLLAEVIDIQTDVSDTFILRRKFMKFLKSLRFRQTSFTVKVNSDGKLASVETLGPARVFSLSAIIGVKQTVVKQVS